MSDKVYLAEVIGDIQQLLAGGRIVRINPQGTSMLPLLRGGRDGILLTAVSGPLKKNDVVLYRRANGQFILHRIIRAGEHDTYDIRGDHQLIAENGVPQSAILAIMTGFVRNGRPHSTDETGYKLYCKTLPLLTLYLKARHLAGRALRKFINRK